MSEVQGISSTGEDSDREAGRRRTPRRGVDLVVALALAAASLVLTTVHIGEHRGYSPFDEYVYIDYYARVLDHGIVRQGSDTGDFARRYISCHVNREFGPLHPELCPAGKKRPSALYPLDGKSTADLYPPVYFFITRVVAQPFVWAGVDFVQAGRYATSFWLALAVVLLFAGLRRMGATRTLSAAGPLIMMSSVGAYFASTYLSTDATALPVGAAALLLAQLYSDRPSRGRQVLILVVSALAGLLKIQNLEAIGVMSSLLVLAAVRKGSSQPRGRLRLLLSDTRTRTAIAALVLGALAQAAWLVVRSSLRVGASADFGLSRGYHLSDLVSNLVAFMVSAPQLGGALGSKLGIWAQISAPTFGLFLPAGVLGLAMGAHVAPRLRHLGWSVLAVSVVSGPVLAAAIIVADGSYVPIAERYGLALMPAMLACLVFLVDQRSRVANWSLLLLGIGFYAMAMAFVR